ncbi:MAG: hypothetical protein M1823_000048 [Watsoniomyces obsoletus]|nr:MAG: hypothetical protein M1823_000048 [Watsoniomyces obsoletus]
MASLITGNKFDPNNDIPDLSGKVFVVIGGSAGIGFGIVAHLLQHKASKIYMLSMKEEHAVQAKESVQQWGDADKMEWVQCNLEDLQQVDQVAKKLKGDLEKLDGLMCNAGLGVGVYNETKDGIDSHFQVNHLSQMHMALTLLPVLQKTPNSRLVVQSSDLHRMSPSGVKFESLDEINQDIGASYLYNRSKLAQVLLIRGLVRRMGQKQLGFQSAEQVWANATHPGAVSTDQQKQAEDAYGVVGKVLTLATRPLMKDALEEGCRPALFALTSPDIVSEKIQGQYIVPDRKPTSPSSQAQDEALGEQLWKLSVDLLTKKLGHLPYQV